MINIKLLFDLNQGNPDQMVAKIMVRDNQIKGVRMVTICRDQSKKFGLKLKSIDAGIFCCFVSVDSPAALVGIRFGDQILKIDGQDCAGMSSDKAFKMLTKADDLKCEVRIKLI